MPSGWPERLGGVPTNADPRPDDLSAGNDWGFPLSFMTRQKVGTPWQGGFSRHHLTQLVRLRCGGDSTILIPAFRDHLIPKLLRLVL